MHLHLHNYLEMPHQYSLSNSCKYLFPLAFLSTKVSSGNMPLFKKALTIPVRRGKKYTLSQSKYKNTRIQELMAFYLGFL